jgi:4'-phosphopantetheinyl transferase
MDIYWFEQSAEDVPPHDDWLSASEQVRLRSFQIPKRRDDWRLGRWTAKCAVAARLGSGAPRLAEVEIRAVASGAPEVWFGGRSDLYTISLSHRERHALCAVAPPGVVLGCDLEFIEPHSAGFVSDYFTANEQLLVGRAVEQCKVLAIVWSAKESALKALRTGLRIDTRSVEVEELELAESSVWNRLRVREPQGTVFHGWWRAAGQFVRTLVADPWPEMPRPVLRCSS